MELFINEKKITNPNLMTISSGELFDVLNPDANLITIEVIAKALSKLCRYGGHCPDFYSVAQHCYYCSLEPGTPKQQMEFLLHDASEAFLADVPRPIKNLLPDYRDIEDNLLKVIFKKYKLNFPLSKKVKKVDDKILVKEFNCFYNNIGSFEFWSHKKAEIKFISRYYELKKMIEIDKK